MMKDLILIAVLFITTSRCDKSDLLIDIDLPENHLSQYFNNLPRFKSRVIHEDTSAGEIYKNFLKSKKYDTELCWGYEYDCMKPHKTHKCPGNHHGFVNSKEAQLDVFYAQADFGKSNLNLVFRGH
jgi:EGF domain-specific O-GlcNAc transferase